MYTYMHIHIYIYVSIYIIHACFLQSIVLSSKKLLYSHRNTPQHTAIHCNTLQHTAASTTVFMRHLTHIDMHTHVPI